ncbi:MAG TPA: nucleotidyltransferase family protein [Chloroflexota bacterium]|jgi:glucose-1-phosphate thymidylyltransferase|nr:nucleotidyltransferase family protein [Chloroflexota bacterium]
MKAIVLAAGYATRLRPLTDTIAKPLLPLADQPLIDYVCDKIDQVEEVDGLHLVTNARFAADFRRWSETRRGRLTPVVHDDGTTSNDDRLGAIGDLRFTIEHGGLAGHDLLVAAGDNLFDFSLADYTAFWRSKGDGSCIALYECPDPRLVSQYSVVELGENDRVVSFVEKPREPKSNLVGIATYLYAADHAALIPTYLKEGNSPDAPGNLVAWLHRRVPVYGYRFKGEWVDIGDPSQLLDADNRLRARKGLPQRSEYSL